MLFRPFPRIFPGGFDLNDPRRHTWDVNIAEAMEIQRALAGLVQRSGRLENPRFVAGCDAAFTDGGACIVGALVLLSFPELEVLERRTLKEDVRMPYVPGLLSFREAPTLERLLLSLPQKPDFIMFDGHGYSHPRRLGLACHLGVRLGIPSVGVAKSILTGRIENEAGMVRGSRSWLIDARSGERLAAVLRTRDGVRPLYVSVGHMLDIEEAVRLVLECGRGRRLPEPTRLADALAAEAKRADLRAAND